MTITLHQRARNLGLSGGCLWLIVVGIAFAAWSLLAVRSSLATSLLAAMCVFAAGLIVFGIAMVRGVLQLAFLRSARTSEGRRIMRRFGTIVAAEGIAIAVVSVACVETHHWIFIVPLTLIIVGFHFLPLARLYDVPRYNVTGALFCAIPIATMLTVPTSAHIGHARSWITMPAVGCALVALTTAWAGLNEVRRFVSDSRAHI